jgi:hypothetical protein
MDSQLALLQELKIGLDALEHMAQNGSLDSGLLLKRVKTLIARRGCSDKAQIKEDLAKQGYPDWVSHRVTPEIEEKAITPNTRFRFWLSDAQINSSDGMARKSSLVLPKPSGFRVFKALLPDQETYQVGPSDLINLCVSLETLRNFDADGVPVFCFGAVIFAWQSVVVSERDYQYYVPVRFFSSNGKQRAGLLNGIRWFSLDASMGDLHRALIISR